MILGIKGKLNGVPLGGSDVVGTEDETPRADLDGNIFSQREGQDNERKKNSEMHG